MTEETEPRWLVEQRRRVEAARAPFEAIMQLWETVSEGSPISPVFATAEDLASWISRPDRTDRWKRDWLPAAAALEFVLAGWAPSGVASGDLPGEVVSGMEAIGMWAEEVASG